MWAWSSGARRSAPTKEGPTVVQATPGGPGRRYSPGMKAIWKDQVIAESNDTVVVEGNHYFPRSSVKPEYLKDSAAHSTCPWKGEASYFSLSVDGQENRDAAWYYPAPKDAAKQIKDRVAFWKGVTVSE